MLHNYIRDMKLLTAVLLLLILCFPSYSNAGFWEDLIKSLGGSSEEEPQERVIVDGLKEALSLGTENAVKTVSQVNGYFGNEVIRIIMPENMRTVADVLSTVGYEKEVDAFIRSMNSAAEKAAPKAVPVFINAIKAITFTDAKSILRGGDTAATDYFEVKTSAQLYEAFKPIISSSMNDVGVTRLYKDMMLKYASIPFVDRVSVDLDQYVTTKSLDGLFYMVGQEEKKIRTDPAARVTDLLKKVFEKEQ